MKYERKHNEETDLYPSAVTMATPTRIPVSITDPPNPTMPVGGHDSLLLWSKEIDLSVSAAS